MSRNGWKAGRKIRKREWYEMNSENLNKGALVSILIVCADAFVLIPFLFWITEEGIIKEENLYPFVLGLMAFQFVVIIMILTWAAIKDSREGKYI